MFGRTYFTGSYFPPGYFGGALSFAYPPTPPTEAELADALAGRRGAVATRFRFYHADNNNAWLADLTPAFVAPACTISLDNDRPILRTANFTLRPAMMPEDFDYLTSNVAVFADVKIIDQWWRFQIGLFRLDQPNESLDVTNDVITVPVTDLSILLMQPFSGVPYTVPVGTNYITAVETVIDTIGLRHNLPANAAVTPIAFTWQPGTPYLTIINELLGGINFFNIWSDVYGVFTSRERIAPSSETPAVAYRTSQEPRMLRKPLARQKTSVRPPNRIIASIQDPLRAGGAGVAENADAASPSSLVYVDVSLQEYGVDRIASELLAALWAAYELRKATGKGQTINLSTHFDPRRDAQEAYLLTYFDHEVETQHRVAAWDMSLGAGAPMRHRIESAPVLSVTTTIVIP